MCAARACGGRRDGYDLAGGIDRRATLRDTKSTDFLRMHEPREAPGEIASRLRRLQAVSSHVVSGVQPRHTSRVNCRAVPAAASV